MRFLSVLPRNINTTLSMSTFYIVTKVELDDSALQVMTPIDALNNHMDYTFTCDLHGLDIIKNYEIVDIYPVEK